MIFKLLPYLIKLPMCVTDCVCSQGQQKKIFKFLYWTLKNKTTMKVSMILYAIAVAAIAFAIYQFVKQSKVVAGADGKKDQGHRNKAIIGLVGAVVLGGAGFYMHKKEGAAASVDYAALPTEF